jgi:Chaperone of endosialidase
MRKQRAFQLMVLATLVIAGLQTAAVGQSLNDGNLANMSGVGSSVRWDVMAQNAGVSLTISAPDGRSFHKDYRAGSAPDFNLSDRQFSNLPDGIYTYELRLSPVLSSAAREALKSARANDDESESERMGRKRLTVPAMVQSGAFTIQNGQIIVTGAIEAQRRIAQVTAPARTPSVVSGNTVSRLRNHRAYLGAMPDDVIADDLIVQGSACIGLDCVNGEVFGFDTIRAKENNTRIQFDDTSAAGFPTNNWQIRANSSAAGGANFLAFVDQGASGNSETGTIVFEVDAGAPANSLKVSSSGKTGIRTATPALDLHINSSDTPAQRLEQNNSGGFTAQIWDIAGNEANFFVRDVTGGSRLPFRIRPGAPTSSVDISASGNVGIGTASPAFKLDVNGAANIAGAVSATSAAVNNSGNPFTIVTPTNVTTFMNVSINGGATNTILGSDVTSGGFAGTLTATNFDLRTANTARLTVLSGGSVGIGTTAPTDLLSVNGNASKPGGGSWSVFSDERLKNIKGRYNSGLSAVMQLQPLRYQYKPDNAAGLKSDQEYVGFGAQAVQKVIPEAVSRNANGYLQVNNDPILWTMLNAIKEQQKEIADLKAEVRKLRTTSHRRRK